MEGRRSGERPLTWKIFISAASRDFSAASSFARRSLSAIASDASRRFAAASAAASDFDCTRSVFAVDPRLVLPSPFFLSAEARGVAGVGKFLTAKFSTPSLVMAVTHPLIPPSSSPSRA